jgi:hypothetical protein
VVSILFWGALLPLAVAFTVIPSEGLSLAALLAYPLQWWRIRRHARRRGWPPADANLYAWGCCLGKLPELTGVLRFVWNRLVRRRASTLMEYRRPAKSANSGAGDASE